jgi:micrococcal nuclease
MRADRARMIPSVPRAAIFPLLVAALAAGAAGLHGCGLGSERTSSPPPGTAQEAAIERVVDGDTIIVRTDAGERERVRLIGIDTPESVKPGTPVECFALRASAFTKHLLTGRRVRLVLDAETHDQYGRLLAYVYRLPDGLFVNAELLRRGMAQTLTFPPNVRFADRFAALARQAREASRGLWASC